MIVEEIEQHPNTALVRSPMLENTQNVLHGTSRYADMIMLLQRFLADYTVFLFQPVDGFDNLVINRDWVEYLPLCFPDHALPD